MSKGKLLLAGGVAAIVLFYTPFGAQIREGWHGQVLEANESSYANRERVESKTRSMMADYAYYKHEYRKADCKADREAARAAANRIAAAYNEYYRKHSFVWAENIPADIDSDLPFVD